MYDDDIGYICMFSDILSGEWNCSILVQVLGFSCGHQFSLIVFNVIHQTSNAISNHSVEPCCSLR